MVYQAKDNQDEGDLETGTRVCRACGNRKPMTSFYYANQKRHRRRKCNVCVEIDRKAQWRKNPESKIKNSKNATNSHLKLKYGLTFEEREKLYEMQGGMCAICKNKIYLGPGTQNSKAHVDHDHETGKVRGLLCFTCNTALGKFKDNKSLLKSAIEYLERYD